MDKNWYVVHTFTGYERKVRQMLKKKIALENKQKEISKVLMPTEDVIKLRNNKEHISKKRTFPSYLLLKMEMTPENFSLVRSIPKVTGFVGGDTPFPIPLTDVYKMMNGTRKEEVKKVVNFAKNDIVKIMDGPFEDFSGIIEEVNAEKQTARVIVTVFGRQTPVLLEYEHIKKTSD